MRKTSLGLGQIIGVSAGNHYQPAGPVCMTCGKVVPYEELVEGKPGWGRTWCKLLVKCHGAEELVTFDFGTEYWDYDDLRSYRMRKNFFDPLASDGIGVSRTPANDNDAAANDNDGIGTVEAPKIVVGG